MNSGVTFFLKEGYNYELEIHKYNLLINYFSPFVSSSLLVCSISICNTTKNLIIIINNYSPTLR